MEGIFRIALGSPRWESPIQVPPAAYAPSQSSAEEASPTHHRNMAGYKARRRVNAGLFGQQIDETERPAEMYSEPSQNRSQGKENRSTFWARLFGKSAPPPPTPPLSTLSESAASTSQDCGDADYYHKIEYKRVEQYPKGSIVQLAAFLDSNDSSCMFRRFGTETLRLIENKAIEIDKLAREIDEIDSNDEVSSTAYRLRSIHQEGFDSDLKVKLEDYEIKINNYYDLVLKFVEVRSLEVPTTVQYNNVYKWIKTNLPIDDDQVQTMHRKDDFVSARKSSSNHRRSGFKDKLESSLANKPDSLWVKFLQGKEEKEKNADPLVRHLSSSSFARFVPLVIAIFVITTMLLPVFIIFLVQPSREVMVSIVAVFVTIVMVSMSLVIDLTAQDVFLGMAAYSAVLVALLSNMMNQGDCGCSN